MSFGPAAHMRANCAGNPLNTGSSTAKPVPSQCATPPMVPATHASSSPKGHTANKPKPCGSGFSQHQPPSQTLVAPQAVSSASPPPSQSLSRPSAHVNGSASKPPGNTNGSLSSQSVPKQSDVT